MPRSPLAAYRKKRDFARTPEPEAELGMGPGGRFVVHEHHASRLHYDLRIEMGGVLKSFAVPKGPSLDPAQRRLAVETEDHPVKYLDFQGSISDGNYGAGQMVIWDRGTYSVLPGEKPLEAYRSGKLHLDFHGERLRGMFMLIRSSRGDRQWLLFKKKDAEAVPGWETPMLLPYASRGERPAGFEIPKEALREAADWSAVPAARKAGRAPKAGAKAERAPAETLKGRNRTREWPDAAAAAPLPDFVEPMLATLTDAPFDREGWVFESKWDGWRAQARVDAKGVHLASRSRNSLDGMFPELLSRAGLRAKECVLDGEIVALDGQGIPKFQVLQSRLKGKARADGGGRIVFYAFDLLHLDGRDLTACTLLERKALLLEVLPEAGDSAWRYSEHFPGAGKAVFREAVRLGLEGVVAKRADSPYRRGRSPDWLKIKAKLRQEVVVAGYTEPRGSRALFGSLVAGLYRDGKLEFAGHVGGGFGGKLLKETHDLMRPLETAECPFAHVPKTNERVHWLKPRLVAEAEFAEWTSDGLMRQPIFQGLRPDKQPEACVREKASAAGGLVARAEAEGPADPAEKPGRRKPVAKRAAARQAAPKAASKAASTAASSSASDPGITHPDKIYWPESGYTKRDLIDYYSAAAPFMLPHLKDRPLILKRFPNGIGSPSFYQHDVKTAPKFVTLAPIEEDDGGIVRYAVCQNRETLLWLANLAVIPQNPWLSRLPHHERPDHVVFDLDPQDSVPFPEVCSMALYLKEVLDGLGLAAFPKTSGSRGIHIYVPLKPAYDFAQGLAFAELVGAYAASKRPDAFTVERSIKARPKGRIYLDCMQNSHGKSVAAVYSAREKPGAPVSAALEWPELKKKFRMEDFNIKTMPARLAKKGDLFAGVLGKGNAIEAALKRLHKLL